MATRSTISVVQEDNSVKSVYCHWDGYIENGVGQELKTFFNSYRLANKVISEGDLSSINRGYIDSYNSLRGDSVLVNQFPDIKSFESSDYEQSFNYLFEDGEWKVSRGNLGDFVEY